MVYSVDKVSEVRRDKPLKDNDEGNEEECSASKRSKQGQGQEEGLELQDKIWKNQEGFTSGSSGKEDEKQEKDVSRSDEDLNSEEDEQKRQGSCEEVEMDTLEQVETQQRQHGAGDTLGTSLEESIGFCQNDSNRDPTVDDEVEKGNNGHLGEDDNQNDEQDGALEKVEPLEWMFTRREVEKGTVEIVYRWPNLFLPSVTLICERSDISGPFKSCKV